MAEAAAPRVSLGRVQLRTLVVIRWLAVAGQAAAILVVHFGFGFPVRLLPALAVVAASAALNLLVLIRYRIGARLNERETAAYLGFDILQLSLLLYLTGGVENPFQLLLLAPVMVSATVLSRQATAALCVLAIGCVTMLAVAHRPLPWSGETPELPPLYVVAVWVATVFAIAFIAGYASRVATEARRLSDALAATQLALAREQRVSALGALAAAAAHELGSPLATIAVVASDIARDLPEDSPLAEDAELLLSQTARCRDILAELARRPEAEGGDSFLRAPLSELVAQAAAPHRRAGIRLAIEREPSDAPEPTLAGSPEILHGLGNLLANAIQFATAEVAVRLRWDARRVEVTITDDGPGFASYLFGRLGEPYLSSRSEDGDHMGLGIFIAETLLQRTGAELRFANRPAGGAEVAATWPRAILEGQQDGKDAARARRAAVTA